MPKGLAGIIPARVAIVIDDARSERPTVAVFVIGSVVQTDFCALRRIYPAPTSAPLILH